MPKKPTKPPANTKEPKHVPVKRQIKPPKYRLIYNVGGPPLIFKTPEDLAQRINDYLECTAFDRWTVTGLALAIGCSVDAIRDYTDRDQFKDVMKRARLMIEHAYEIRVVEGKGSTSGCWNIMKNLGWKDRTEVHQEHTYTQMGKIKAKLKDGSVKELSFNVGKKKK